MWYKLGCFGDNLVWFLGGNCYKNIWQKEQMDKDHWQQK